MEMEALSKAKIKMKSNWHQWCRLCAGDFPDNMDVYSMETRNLVMAVGKYFWVDIKMDDELSQYLCLECYSLLTFLIDFSERVHQVQRMYGKLQSGSSNLDNDDIRKQFGDWVHMKSFLRRSQNPETKTAMAANAKEGDPELVEDLLIIEQQEVVEEEEEEQKQNLEQDQVEEDQEHDEEVHQKQEDETAEIIAEFEDDTFDEDDAFDGETSAEDETVKLEQDISILDRELEELDEIAPSEYKCKLCPKVYKKATAYKRHLVTLHGISPKNLANCQCQQCDITFSTINELATHYGTHVTTKEKKGNTCQLCSKLFTTAGALNRHIAGTHNKLTPFVCDICGKAVKTLASLKDHKLVHTDACPFECDVCHRRFKNKARLRVHSDSHTEGYDCDICGMTLKTRRTLNTHRQVHSDERKCKCEVCGATFKRSKTLKSHLILHTGIRPYKCNFCGAEFANGSNCRMHKRKKHPKELAEEESRRVIRSTRLPLIDDLTEASKRIKTPARKAAARTKSSNRTKNSINPLVSPGLEEDDDYILNNLVGEM